MSNPAPPVRPYVFECGSCGAVRNSPDPRIPVGWSTCEGAVWCTDCTTAGIPARELAKPATKRRAA